MRILTQERLQKSVKLLEDFSKGKMEPGVTDREVSIGIIMSSSLCSVQGSRSTIVAEICTKWGRVITLKACG